MLNKKLIAFPNSKLSVWHGVVLEDVLASPMLFRKMETLLLDNNKVLTQPSKQLTIFGNVGLVFSAKVDVFMLLLILFSPSRPLTCRT